MSVYFEGNAFIDGGHIQNTRIMSSTVDNSAITTSTLDMDMNNITSVKDPIDPQDAATKKYVDDLDIVISSVTLNGTGGTLISSYNQGSYVITVNSIVLNGPTGVFHVTKSDASRQAHVVRTAAAPGYMTNITLMVSWPQNSGIFLRKTGGNFDGSYRVKVM
jgi:hypothetical protein